MNLISDELTASGITANQIFSFDLDRYGFRSVKTPEQLESLIAPLLKILGMTYIFIDKVQSTY